MKKTIRRGLFAASLLLLSGAANAALIASYSFDAGSATDGQGTYNLSTVGTADFTGGSYASDGSASNYLQVTGPGGLPDFTVSLWAYTSSVNQGDFKGVFSNNINSAAANSWQIDSSGGRYTLRTQAGVTFDIGAVAEASWQHIALQKFGGNNARVYLDNALVGVIGSNPGGLQYVRVGINRNSNQSFDGLIDNIQVYNDSAVDVLALFSAGPGLTATAVPEPGSLALLSLGLIGLGAVSRRRKLS